MNHQRIFTNCDVKVKSHSIRATTCTGCDSSTECIGTVHDAWTCCII